MSQAHLPDDNAQAADATTPMAPEVPSPPAILEDPLLASIPVVDGAKRLGTCNLTAKLGQGGMGAVYRGYHTQLNMPVAVKILPFHLASGAMADQAKQRFKREAQLTVQLDHPNLIRMMDVNVTDQDVYYLIMEYVQGETTAQALKRCQEKTNKPLTERTVVNIAMQVVSAIGYAHGQGIIHRDIKPDNIMIRRADGRIKLMDLGLAKAIDADEGVSMTSTGMGSPHYMSPEQASDAKHANAASDIYSIGATMYHLVTGRTVFQGPSVYALIKKIHEDAPEDPRTFCPGLSEELRGIILRCLDKDTTKRHTAAELLKALRAVPDGRLAVGGKSLTAAAATGAMVATTAGVPTKKPATVKAANKARVGPGAPPAAGAAAGVAGLAAPAPATQTALASTATVPMHAAAAPAGEKSMRNRMGLILFSLVGVIALLLVVLAVVGVQAALRDAELSRKVTVAMEQDMQAGDFFGAAARWEEFAAAHPQAVLAPDIGKQIDTGLMQENQQVAGIVAKTRERLAVKDFEGAETVFKTLPVHVPADKLGGVDVAVAAGLALRKEERAFLEQAEQLILAGLKKLGETPNRPMLQPQTTIEPIDAQKDFTPRLTVALKPTPTVDFTAHFQPDALADFTLDIDGGHNHQQGQWVFNDRAAVLGYLALIPQAATLPPNDWVVQLLTLSQNRFQKVFYLLQEKGEDGTVKNGTEVQGSFNHLGEVQIKGHSINLPDITDLLRDLEDKAGPEERGPRALDRSDRKRPQEFAGTLKLKSAEAGGGGKLVDGVSRLLAIFADTQKKNAPDSAKAAKALWETVERGSFTLEQAGRPIKRMEMDLTPAPNTAMKLVLLGIAENRLAYQALERLSRTVAAWVRMIPKQAGHLEVTAEPQPLRQQVRMVVVLDNAGLEKLVEDVWKGNPYNTEAAP